MRCETNHLHAKKFAIVATLASIPCIFVLSSDIASSKGFFHNIGREVGSCLSGGCDVVWSVNRRLDAGISSKSKSTIEPVQRAVDQILNDLFLNKINPMLDKMNYISEERLDQVESIVQKAIESAKSASADTISQVKNDIVIESGNQMREVARSIRGDLVCTGLTTRESAQSFVDNNFRIFGDLRDTAHGLIDKCSRGVDRNNYWTVYNGLKCAYEVKISNAASIAEMQNEYRSFLEETSKAECILQNDSNRLQAQSDQREYTKRLNVWNLALQ